MNLALSHSLCVFPSSPDAVPQPRKAPPPPVAPRPRARPRLMPSSSIKEKQGPLQELFGLEPTLPRNCPLRQHLHCLRPGASEPTPAESRSKGTPHSCAVGFGGVVG